MAKKKKKDNWLLTRLKDSKKFLIIYFLAFGIFLIYLQINPPETTNGGNSKSLYCKLSYANSGYCHYSCTKGDRYLLVTPRHPNPSAFISPSNSGCPGWPPNLTEKQFDAAAK
jgi:hypothetical protein